MDEFGKRAALLATYPEIVEKIGKEQKNRDRNQYGLFDNDPKPLKSYYEVQTNLAMDEFSEKEKLLFERELLGFFLTDHPLNQELETLFKRTSHRISSLAEEKEGSKIRVGGMVANVKKIFTRKNNSEMAFLTLEDNIGYSIECVVFPKVFDMFKYFLIKDSIVIVEGKIDFKDDRPVLIVESLEKLQS